MPARLRLSCRALLIIVLVRPNSYSAGHHAPHQLNPSLDTNVGLVLQREASALYIMVGGVVAVVTFFSHNFVNCKATLILAIKIYEIKCNISLNDIHT